MNQPRLAERSIPTTTPARLPRPRINPRDASLGPALQHLADALRDRGHSVHTASVHPPSTDDDQLAADAAYFFDQALGLSDAASSRRAHIRVYRSNTLLFLEVTQLKPHSYDAATRHSATHDALHELNEWSRRRDRPLSIRRGPRDQLRIALLMPCDPAPGDDARRPDPAQNAT
jgi:hypothetical protein